MSKTSHVTPSEKSSLLRRLYDWTLNWANHPAGTTALFLLAFAESSFFPIPPDVLLMALCVGAVKKSFRFAAVCAVGSVLGGMAGYGIGYFGYEAIGEPILIRLYGDAMSEKVEKIEGLYREYGFLGNLIAAITPIPYKIFTIMSGFFKYPFHYFVLASVIGRSFRFFAVATVLYYFGAPVKVLIEKYFDWVAWGFMILLILGFVLLKLL